MKYPIISLLALLVNTALQAAQPAVPLTRFSYQLLRPGEVQPTGWLRTELDEDFHQGLPGQLDTINEDIAHETFASQNRDITAEGQPTWWSGEQEGYWHEAYVHSAFLLNDAKAIARITQYVDGVLKSQTPEGYIGIYAPETRLLPVTDPRYGDTGGELHSQAHCFLTLLAFYEYTGRKDVLDAVQRAAKLTMRTYKDGAFGTTGKQTPRAGGNSHSVTFIDPMVQLYRLTGDEEYLRFVTSLYDSYNQHPPRDHDLAKEMLDDPKTLFTGHGAHTAEALHMVRAVALLDPPGTKQRADTVLERLANHLTPGGALISDEYVGGQFGSGDALCEYCTQAELLKSLGFLTQYTGNTLTAERAARLFFNSLQGSRLHPLSALQYFSRDNRLDVPAASKKEITSRREGILFRHFQMSSIIRPTCCPASSGRALPYFLTSTWMKGTDGKTLALMNAAPTTVTTEMDGVSVKIAEETCYPFSDQVTLAIDPEKPVAFDLAIRMPPEGDLKVEPIEGARVDRRDGLLVLHKTWQPGDRVKFSFDLPVVLETTKDGKAQYYRRGSLTFALPFACELKQVKENPRWSDQKPSGLFEYDIKVPDKSAWSHRLDPKAKFEPVSLPGDPLQPWQKPTLGLQGTMIDSQDRPVAVTLVPEGAALARRVTFLDASHSAEEAAQIEPLGKVSVGN